MVQNAKIDILPVENANWQPVAVNCCIWMLLTMYTAVMIVSMSQWYFAIMQFQLDPEAKQYARL